MLKKLLILLLLASTPAFGQFTVGSRAFSKGTGGGGGGTFPAATCSRADVQAAITAEQVGHVDGDLITIPAGTCTWTGVTQIAQTFPNSVTIQGAGAISSTTGGASTTGTDQTIIIDDLSTSAAMVFTTTSGKSFRFTGVALKENGSSPISSSGMLEILGTSTAVTVDHNHFFSNQGGSSSFHLNGSVQGVADLNYFEALSGILNNHIGFQNGQGWNGASSSDWGDNSWATADNWGTSQFFFIEDCRFFDGDTDDAVFGARFVFRHNTVTGDGASSQQMFWHGATAGRERGGRAAEVYGNIFTQAGNYGSPPVSLNSGTVLAWGNTVTGGYKSLLQISYDFRTTAGGGGAYHYLPPPNGWGFCGPVAGGPTFWDSNLNSSGYACLDQPGRGAGQLLNGLNFPGTLNTATGTIAWPHQKLSPVYVFNNTYVPMFYTTIPVITENTGGSDGSIASNNREFYMDFGPLANPGSFNGTVGIGVGVFASRPGTCTQGTDPITSGAAPGVGYWATDQSILYVCNPTNTWTTYYTPYTYPHPLAH